MNIDSQQWKEYALEAVGKRPSAIRQAHGPEQGRRAALPSSLVTAAYFCVRLIPRDFGSLAYGHFPSASQKAVFPLFLKQIGYFSKVLHEGQVS